MLLKTLFLVGILFLYHCLYFTVVISVEIRVVDKLIAEFNLIQFPNVMQCLQRDTCENLHRRCFCDNKCQFYHDCCVDYLPTDEKAELGLPDFICDKKYEAIIHRGCRSGDNRLRVLCKNTRIRDINRFAENVIVYDFTTGLTYRNIYCALCESKNVQIKPWKIEFQCENGEILTAPEITKLSFNRNTGDWFYSLNKRQHGCNFFQISDEKLSRKCSTTLDQCSKPVGDNIREKCRSFLAPIRDQRNVYRNVFCGNCSNFDIQQLNCEESNMKALIKTQLPALTIDLNVKIGIDSTGKSVNCSESNAFFDSVFQTCRNWLCLSRQTSKNGSCVINYNHEKNHPTSTDCAKKQLNQSQYKLIDLNITLTNSGRFLGPDDYSIVDKKIFVCQDLIEEIEQTKVSSTNEQWHFPLPMRIIACISSTFSLILLSIYLFVYLVHRKKSLAGNNFASLCLAQLISYLAFILLQVADFKLSLVICQLISALFQFSSLSVIFWLNVIAYEVFRRVYHIDSSYDQKLNTQEIKRRFVHYSLYAWGTSLVICILNLLISWLIDFLVNESSKNSTTTLQDLAKNFVSSQPTGQECSDELFWFKNGQVFGNYFVLPILTFSLICALLFFAIFIVRKQRTYQLRSMGSGVESVYYVLLYFKLFSLILLTWLLCFVGIYWDFRFIWFIFIILYSSIGFIIFHRVICKKDGNDDVKINSSIVESEHEM